MLAFTKFFEVKQNLTSQDLQQGYRALVYDGLASQAMLLLTGGTFLVAASLYLGASNLQIGLLAAIPPLLQLVQLPSIYLVEKYRQRKRIVIYTVFFSRLMLILLAWLPFLMFKGSGIYVVLFFITVSAGFNAIATCSWNSWMKDVIPAAEMGMVFSRRLIYQQWLTIALVLAGGFFVDWWGMVFPTFPWVSYAILFSIGFISGMIGILFIIQIPETEMEEPDPEAKFWKVIVQPFQDENFRNLIYFLSWWSFAINLAAPFFTVYLFKNLQLNLTQVNFLFIISQVSNLFLLKFWGKMCDLYSNKTVMSACGITFVFCLLAWTFTTLPEKHVLTWPLLILIHIVMGGSIAGVMLASGNIGLKLAPKGEAVAYLASLNFVVSIAAGIAPILGGQFVDYFEGCELSWIFQWISPNKKVTLPTFDLQHWDFFFVFAFLLGLYSLHRLALVKETGEVEENVVMTELLAEMRGKVRNLSTVGGVRYMMFIPFWVIRQIREKRQRGRESEAHWSKNED